MTIVTALLGRTSQIRDSAISCSTRTKSVFIFICKRLYLAVPWDHRARGFGGAERHTGTSSHALPPRASQGKPGLSPSTSSMDIHNYPGRGLSLSQLIFALNEELKRVAYSPPYVAKGRFIC